MLPDYPDLKRDLMNVVLRFVRNAEKQHAVPLAGIQVQRHFEGDRHSLARRDDDVEESDFQELGTTLSLQTDELPTLSLSDVLLRLDTLAQELASKRTQMLYASIDKATAKAGTAIHAGEPISVELVLNALETIDFDFDPDGSPRMPALHVHPSRLSDVKQVDSEIRQDPRLQKRMEDVIARKREDWRTRESSRRLVG